MKKIRIGVLCPSEIAFRRFMPALKKTTDFEYVGIAAARANEWATSSNRDVLTQERSKAEKFISEYGGMIFDGYEDLICSDKIDAVYMPLPPALHFKWGKRVLEMKKHLLLEKPFTTQLRDTEALVDLARKGALAVHENYMFIYHSQLDHIRNMVNNGAIGEIRLIRIDFGFPFRSEGDFRYNRELGGGALLDCGGYTLKLASVFLGYSAKIIYSGLNYKQGFDVDIYGNAVLRNDKGLTAQVSFGMDNSYRCALDVWGSKGSIFTDRILTAPDGYEPIITIKTQEGEKQFVLPGDDSFKKSIEAFGECINNTEKREINYRDILRQGSLLENFERN